MTFTAVTPYFRVVYSLFACRTCGWAIRVQVEGYEDQGPEILARHLAVKHQTGPLAKPYPTAAGPTEDLENLPF